MIVEQTGKPVLLQHSGTESFRIFYTIPEIYTHFIAKHMFNYEVCTGTFSFTNTFLTGI